jgi:hypothetical protein
MSAGQGTSDEAYDKKAHEAIQLMFYFCFRDYVFHGYYVWTEEGAVRDV